VRKTAHVLAGFLLPRGVIGMSRIHAFAWLLTALAAVGCSLNPQVDPPSALKETTADAGGSPIFGGGGMGGAPQNAGSGGRAQGGFSGAGGLASQGGAYGSGGSPGRADASDTPDGAAPVEAGTDGRADGAVSDSGTDAGTDAGTAKEAGRD
jgi:hypothetical protein